MHVAEDMNDGLKKTKVGRRYEDPYTLELEELYERAVNGKACQDHRGGCST